MVCTKMPAHFIATAHVDTHRHARLNGTCILCRGFYTSVLFILFLVTHVVVTE